MSACKSHKNSLPKISVVSELFVVLLNGAILTFHILRTLVLMESQTSLAISWMHHEPEIFFDFAKLQVAQNMFLLGYWNVFVIIESVHRLVFKTSLLPGNIMGLFAIFVAGAIAQGQGCHILSMLYDWDAYNLKPRSPSTIAIAGNCLLVILTFIHAILWNTGTSTLQSKMKNH